MGERVTIEDIAKKLNISRSLVSKALNDKYGVSPVTRMQIRYTALKMGYDFQNIRGNPDRRTAGIQVLIGDVDAFFAESFYLSLLRSIEEVCTAEKLAFSLCPIRQLSPEGLSAVSASRLSGKGVLLICGSDSDLSALGTFGVPFVVVDDASDELRVNRVRMNSFSGSTEATAYLLEMGHRRIGFAGEAELSANLAARYRGYRETMEKNGLTDYAGYCCIDRPGPEDEALLNTEALRRLLQSENAPTALLCANDKVAGKVYEVAASLGISVPEKLSVVGFDDEPLCQWMEPRLTSVRCDVMQMARYAVTALRNASAHPEGVPVAITLDPVLVRRESVNSRL